MDQNVNREVSAKIIQRLAAKPADHTELADAMGISETTQVRRLTSGAQSFTIAELVRAADFLGCSITDLIPAVIAADCDKRTA